MLRYQQLFKFIPLTLSGACVLALSLFSLFMIGLQESDLIAMILGTAGLLIISVSLLSLLFSVRAIKRGLAITSNFPTHIYSKENVKTLLYIQGIKIPPLFFLKIDRSINQENGRSDKKLKTNDYLLFGSFIDAHINSKKTSTQNLNNFNISNPNINIITDYIVFPNRGLYSENNFSITFGDVFGLTKLGWVHNIKNKQLIEVFPPSIEIKPIQIMAASSELGDFSHDSRERTGDLFDYKPYQQGDSLKRVLWKTFARSQSLIVRNPEPAVMPEGEVYIFVIASEKDDTIVSAALSYIGYLEEQNLKALSYFIGTSQQADFIASNKEEATRLSIRYKLNTNISEQATELLTFHQTLKDSSHGVNSIIIFAPSINNKINIETSKCLEEVINISSQLGLKTTVIMDPTTKSNYNLGNDIDSIEIEFRNSAL